MKKIVVFSGAGMSAESGINTFRDSGGLWEKFKVEDVATPDAWRNNPELVQEFYNERRKQIIKALPNKAHFDIATLENNFNVVVITQNIDDLHERAGSTNVIHLHGNIRYAKSSGPKQEETYYPIKGWELKTSDLCKDGFPLRPHVVWFGEEVPLFGVAQREIETGDILIVIGTSLQVYPAASLVHYTREVAEKYLIDPNGAKLGLSNGFEVICQEAVIGIETCIKMINKKSDA
jgi:NAD-dependent deacetylase